MDWDTPRAQPNASLPQPPLSLPPHQRSSLLIHLPCNSAAFMQMLCFDIEVTAYASISPIIMTC